VDGTPPELTLTTNGSLLARKARSLKDAGLQRVTVSLDGLDDAVFRPHERRRLPVAEVLEGIAAAREAGPRAGEGQHGRQARHERARDPADGAATSVARASCCASSSTWTSASPTAGAWTK
jgi:hypothetical protein